MKRSAVVRLGACAAFALAAACGTPGKQTTTARPEDPSEAVRREVFPVVTGELIFAIVRDATHLYWADLTGVHRRPLGDADAGGAKLVTDATAAWGDVAAMVIGGDRLYLSDGVSVYSLPAAGGELVELRADVGLGLGQPIVGLGTVGSGDVVVASYTEIALYPKKGEPRSLVHSQVRITSLAIDGEYVYWTDYGEDPAAVPMPGGYYGGGYYGGGDPSLFSDGPGVVRRVGIGGGTITDLATSQRGPSSVVVWGGRVWWSSDRGPGVQSAPVEGGEARLEVRGRADRIAHDDAGLLVHNVNGLISEWSGGTSGEVRMVADGRWLTTARPILLTPEWIYVLAMHPSDARQAVIAVPRQDEAVEVVAAVSDSVTRVRVRDGVLWWIEMMRGTSGLAISLRDPSTGEARQLARHEGYLTEVAVGNGELYFAEDQSIYRVSAGGKLQRFATSNGYPVALTVHRDHVFWSDSNQVMAKKRKGGQPFVVAQTSVYGNADQGADLVFDDDYAFLVAYGGNGTMIFRISERGEVASVWDATSSGIYPLRDLVSVAGELFFSASISNSSVPVVYRMGKDGDGSLFHTLGSNDRYIIELTAGGGFLYVTLQVNDVIELIRIDASSAEASTVFRWQGYAGDPGVLSADDTGAYLAIEPYDAVIRIAHDAPAVVAPVQFGPM